MAGDWLILDAAARATKGPFIATQLNSSWVELCRYKWAFRDRNKVFIISLRTNSRFYFQFLSFAATYRHTFRADNEIPVVAVRCISYVLFTLRRAAAAAAIPMPTNVHVRRTSPTSIEVTWDPSAYNGIAGYRIYYSELALPSDMDQWRSVDVGPYTVAEVSGLEPHSAYAVRVRAKSVVDARLSNFSDIAYTNRLNQGLSRFLFLHALQRNKPLSIVISISIHQLWYRMKIKCIDITIREHNWNITLD